jgi:peptidoglycan/xylan/chitin deacetylase (PgdA/CDA1 family)
MTTGRIVRIPQRLFEISTRKVMGTITHVETKEPIAALTFDDGPHRKFTPQLLKILERHGARGTFFMIGKVAHRQPDLVRRVAQDGHAIGNHSWDHPSFPLITRRERLQQIRDCAKALAPYGQKLFRPPYGHQNLASRLDVLRLGYQVVNWNIVAKDWLDYDPIWMAEHVISKIQPGSVINFHDALYTTVEERYADRGPMIKAVALILERLGGKFSFITVPELLKRGRAQRQSWYQKADPNFLNGLHAQEGETRQYGV